MRFSKSLNIFLGAMLASSPIFALRDLDADMKVAFWGNSKFETFGASCANLLNNNIGYDEFFYNRHTIDWNSLITFGERDYGYPVAELKLTFRNKVNWADQSSGSQTSDSITKTLDAFNKSHNHFLPRLFPWMREASLEFSLGDALGLSVENTHTFKLGAFPFELGRGIALGSAYAVGPYILGFYADGTVDQFAFGAKFTGDLLANKLSYDFYGAVLQNKSTSFSQTGEKIFAQEYGHQTDSQRGFGKVNYLVAGRTIWTVFETPKNDKLTFEPYWLYNNDPEQKLEFVGDAKSHLGTIGFASEFVAGNFECGFDSAINFGYQAIKGWDRNQIELRNINGQVILVNNKVVDQNGNNIVFVPKSNAQKIINNAVQSSDENGQFIGQVPGGVGIMPGPLSLFNGPNRFRGRQDPAYFNTYKGLMWVGDAAYSFYNKQLQVAFTAGLATGTNVDPNNIPLDTDFNGFLGLQETYSGKRVKSVFLLGGAGRLRRPVSGPDDDQAPNQFGQGISGFSNLGLVGAGFTWKPKTTTSRFTINPNVLAYWEYAPSRKFDAKTQTQLEEQSRPFLGTEVDLIMNWFILDNLKMFSAGSVFFPGGHYTDIKGRPLDAEQRALLNRLNDVGFDPGNIPNQGDSIAFTFNVGLDLSF